MQRRTPLWLSHHYPHEYDRCLTLGGRHVCRRCAVFYPLCFATTALALAGLRWPIAADTWLLWLLPVPVVCEWWLEHLDIVRYSAARNVAFSVMCAPAVGIGLARYLENPGDSLFWAVVITYAVICIIPMILARRAAASTR